MKRTEVFFGGGKVDAAEKLVGDCRMSQGNLLAEGPTVGFL